MEEKIEFKNLRLFYDNREQAFEDLKKMYPQFLELHCEFLRNYKSGAITINDLLQYTGCYVLKAQALCIISNELKIDLADLYLYGAFDVLYIDNCTAQKIIKICMSVQEELVYNQYKGQLVTSPAGERGWYLPPFNKPVRELFIDKPIIWGKEFSVRHCLIPHFNSLVLANISSRMINIMFNGQGNFIDIGTGSGIYGIKICQDNPGVTGTLSDISKRSLKTAQKNIETFGLQNCTTLESNVLRSYTGPKLDAVISNPPFLTKEHLNRTQRLFQNSPGLANCINELDIEPSSSIYYKGTPLYKRILRESIPHLRDKFLIMLECDGSIEQQTLIQQEAISLLDNPNILVEERFIFITNNMSKYDMLEIVKEASCIPVQTRKHKLLRKQFLNEKE